MTIKSKQFITDLKYANFIAATFGIKISKKIEIVLNLIYL